MSAEGEREAVSATFDYRWRNLEQLKASIAATDQRLTGLREAIHRLGYRSVAEALEANLARDDSIEPHPSDSPTAGAAGLLPWVFVLAVVSLSILFVLLGGAKLPASNNRPSDIRYTSLDPVTTAIAPRENEGSLPDAPDADALPDGTDANSSLRQPEPSIIAPQQEPTIRLAIRSTLPSEDDPFPAAALAALLPPPTATPGTADSITTFPAPRRDLRQIEDAKRIQRRLIDLGFLFGTADGNWGPRSRKALQTFRVAQRIGNNDTWDEEAERGLFSPTAVRAPASGTFVGGWAINVDQCRSPLQINTQRAEAFGATCQFNSTQRESANEWRIRASCADEHDQWNANIRLTLGGSRLIWASERGTVTYLRCPVISN